MRPDRRVQPQWRHNAYKRFDIGDIGDIGDIESEECKARLAANG
ncbi:hypothetical protein [Shewanella xiamenensis]|nr:hypothetical protein [Shewanella xiamenensis]